MNDIAHKANNGNSPKPQLSLDSLKHFRIFAVAYGQANRPQTTAFFSFHFFPKQAREEVRNLRRVGYLAEVVTFQIPSHYFA